MSSPETYEYDHVLVDAIVALQPDLYMHYISLEEGKRDDVGVFIAGTFGKYWHIETMEYEEAGVWAEVASSVKGTVSREDERTINQLVKSLFPDMVERHRMSKEYIRFLTGETKEMSPELASWVSGILDRREARTSQSQ